MNFFILCSRSMVLYHVIHEQLNGVLPQRCVTPTKGLTKHLLNCYQNKFYKMKIKTQLYMLLSVIIYIISNY